MKTWILSGLIALSFGYTYIAEQNAVRHLTEHFEKINAIIRRVKMLEESTERDFFLLHKRIHFIEMIHEDFILEVAKSVDPHILTLDDYQTALLRKVAEDQKEGRL